MGDAAGVRGRGAGVALGFAIAAAAACWNPFAAPFGLVVGCGAAILAWRARRAGARRGLAGAALGLGAVAAAVSLAVVLLTAGAVGTDLPGQPVVQSRTQAELDQALDQAAARTRAERERAARELDRLPGGKPAGGSPSPAPQRGARPPPAPPGARR